MYRQRTTREQRHGVLSTSKRSKEHQSRHYQDPDLNFSHLFAGGSKARGHSRSTDSLRSASSLDHYEGLRNNDLEPPNHADTPDYARSCSVPVPPTEQNRIRSSLRKAVTKAIGDRERTRAHLSTKNSNARQEYPTVQQNPPKTPHAQTAVFEYQNYSMGATELNRTIPDRSWVPNKEVGNRTPRTCIRNGRFIDHEKYQRKSVNVNANDGLIVQSRGFANSVHRVAGDGRNMQDSGSLNKPQRLLKSPLELERSHVRATKKKGWLSNS